jgi:putative ABC transport system permease protein
MQTMLVVCLAGLAVVLGVLTTLAVKDRILLKLGARKVARRPGRTLLIVFGLMLGTTIVTAAFSTGDTMSHTIRTSALAGLGHIDEVISAKTSELVTPGGNEPGSTTPFIDAALLEDVRTAAASISLIDGVTGAIAQGVAVQDVTSRQNEPRMTLSATDTRYQEGFDPITVANSGEAGSLDDLGPDEAYLNTEAAEELQASPGDELLTFAGGAVAEFSVRAIVDAPGAGRDGPVMLVSLAAAQELFGQPGQINYILISNDGDALAGAARSDEVIAALQPAINRLGLQIEAEKQDALRTADEAGNSFTSVFVTFGMFSIAAGLMLIFLIFVMIAAERKSEMGIARAVGTQRRHLVEMFLFEGMVYDVAAAAVGALLGVGVAFGMVFLLAQAFGQIDLTIEHDMRPRSVVVAYSLGVLLTFAIVTLSAWRVSRLNIVTAIRDVPEAARRATGRAGWLPVVLLVVLGGLMLVSGLQAEAGTPFNLGVSLLIIALVPLLGRFGVPDRARYTLAGLLLIAWWLMPPRLQEAFLPEMTMDFSIFVIAGLLAVIGGSWVVMYNSDLLFNGLMALVGRMRLAPVVKTAVSRALSSRFRTGMTVTMFAIVVMTLVVMAVIRGSIIAKFSDYADFGAGFDVQATTLQTNAIPDIEAALANAPGIDQAGIEAVSTQSFSMLDLQQVGSTAAFDSYPVRGIDQVYADRTTLRLARRAAGYATDRDVWRAVASDTRLAVIDPIPVPRRANFNVGVGLPDFMLEGLFLEDEEFQPIDIVVREQYSGTEARYTIVGILGDTMSETSIGLQVSQAGLAESFGERVTPNVYVLKLAPGTDAAAMATALEREFLMNGMDAASVREKLDDALAMQRNFDYLFQGFAALGLFVGVAALGVISARAVVERRQQIGVLRAVGFQRSMVQLSFLMESSFVALLGIAIGLVLGLAISFNVVTDDAITGGAGAVPVLIPWANLGIILGVAYAVALVATWLPSLRASRIYPAEALRYQ